MYQVLENNIPADNKHFPELKNACWSNSIFNSFEEAKLYAFCWSYPVSIEEAIEWSNRFEMKLDVEYDFSMSEVPNFMKITKVDIKNN
jgi:hypothetical protein